MKYLSSFFLAASLLAGACTNNTRANGPSAPSDPIVDAPIHRPARLDRAKVRAALAERRATTYARFLAYREARVYPVNDAAGFEHVWLDAFGHLCAAATMIEADWGFVATANVAARDNHIALASVEDGALRDWVLTSGLTHHEVVAIQRPGFRADVEPPPPIEQAVVDPRVAEIQRLYDGYLDVERQLTSMWDENLDDATDALMKRPELARALIGGVAAGPGEFAGRATVTVGFAQPPT